METLQNILYINIESRKDRNQHFIQQCKNVGFQNPQRVNAIVLKNGALGCSMSHAKCLQIAIEKNWENVLICEDDFECVDVGVFKKQVEGFLSENRSFDVALFGGNNQGAYEVCGENCIKITNVQCAVCYLVKRHYYETLLENFKTGIRLFMENPDKPNDYGIDQFWKRLQPRDNWFMIVPLTVTQKIDYSNIENRMVNYSWPMLVLNK
jgi:GR25 family glycosyltransferase involved in LPS biosynthesis